LCKKQFDVVGRSPIKDKKQIEIILKVVEWKKENENLPVQIFPASHENSAITMRLEGTI